MRGLSRFAGRPLTRSRGLRLGVGDQPAQPGHRPPARELRPALRRSRRDHRPLHPAVLAAGERRRPGRHGGHAGRRGSEPVDRRQVIEAFNCKHVLAAMATAGLYEHSGDWLYEVGLPGKSGVSGGIVTISPGKGGLGTFSPPLDEAGNSVRGQRATRHVSEKLGLNIFASSRSSLCIPGAMAGDGEVDRRSSHGDPTDLAHGRVHLPLPGFAQLLEEGGVALDAELDRGRTSRWVDTAVVGRPDGEVGPRRCSSSSPARSRSRCRCRPWPGRPAPA